MPHCEKTEPCADDVYCNCTCADCMQMTCIRPGCTACGKPHAGSAPVNEDDGVVMCKLYPVRLVAEFDIMVAAPMDMSYDDVQKLIESKKKDILDEEDGRYEWRVEPQGFEEGTAGDTNRHTYVVDDKREDLVRGEETAWLPEPVRASR